MKTHSQMPDDLPDVATPLLQWFRSHQRPLPWRQDYDPYRIWVVEIMLQQTQVQTVIPYFQRFLERFPSVHALARASIDEVLESWAGLGYYRRARYLHQAAQQIVSDHGGRVPSSLDELMKLSGVGRYTAGAIRSIGFNLDAPIVDGNVMRVLARLFAIQGDAKRTDVQRRFWALAEELLPSGHAREFNQGVMELGAMVCTPLQPRCDVCPLNAVCQGFPTGNPTQFPQMPKRPKSQAQRSVAAVLERDGLFLLGQRSAEERWGGLWEFPRITCREAETDSEALRRLLQDELLLRAQIRAEMHTLRHTVMHYRITLAAYHCEWQSGEPQSSRYTEFVWCARDSLMDFAAPSPQTRLVKHLLESSVAEAQLLLIR